MEHEQTPLAGIDWDSQRVQGPEDNPNHWSRRRSSDYQPYVGQQWRDYLSTERQRIADKQGVIPAWRGGTDTDQNAARASMYADPEHARVQHLTELLNDTHGNPYGDNFDYAKNTPIYQPLSMMQSKRWTYNKYEAENEQTSLDKINKIASRRGLPADYSINIEAPAGTSHHSPLYYATLTHKGEGVGTLSWHGGSGYVNGLHIDEGHRHLLPQMISKAHEVSHETGHTGPTASDQLSAYSYNVMHKHAASFIPEGTMIEGEDEHWYDDVVRAHQEAAQTVKAHLEAAKPHLLAAIGDDPESANLLSVQESHLKNVIAHSNTGRINQAGAAAAMVRHVNNRLLQKHGQQIGIQAFAEISAAATPLNKLANNDFGDEIYGH